MSAEDLKAELQVFYDNYDEIGIAVYAILKGEDASPKKIDIEADSLSGLKRLFIDSLKETISDKDDLSVLDLSASDERVDAIYKYDIDLPEELGSLEDVISTDDLPLMSLQDNNLSNIKAMLIEIGNNVGQIVLYKTMASINIFGKSNFFLKRQNQRLEKIDDEFLRVSAGFQLARINDDLYVIDLSAIEKNFGFHEIISKEATVGINAIEAIGLVENPEVLHELVDDVRYARKFTKVAKASPVLKAEIQNNSIINFCKTFPKLVGKIRFSDDESQIMLDTKVSKDLFIKLLMDDFLTSELTNFHYESVAKDSAEAEAEPEDS